MKKILFLMTLLVMGVPLHLRKQMQISSLTKQLTISVSFLKTARLSVAHLPLLISAMPLW